MYYASLSLYVRKIINFQKPLEPVFNTKILFIASSVNVMGGGDVILHINSWLSMYRRRNRKPYGMKQKLIKRK